MVFENIGLGFMCHWIKWGYSEFYTRWSQVSTKDCNVCVWIVPGTIPDDLAQQ